MITIVDYGLGNIRAFLNVYARLNIEAKTAGTYRRAEGRVEGHPPRRGCVRSCDAAPRTVGDA